MQKYQLFASWIDAVGWTAFASFVTYFGFLHYEHKKRTYPIRDFLKRHLDRVNVVAVVVIPLIFWYSSAPFWLYLIPAILALFMYLEKTDRIQTGS